MEWADHQTSRRFFDLFLYLVDNGTLDEARGPTAVNSTFWSMLYGLGESRPEWVPEVLAHWLRRCLAVIRHAGEDLNGRELLGSDGSCGKDVFRVCSTRSRRLRGAYIASCSRDFGSRRER